MKREKRYHKVILLVFLGLLLICFKCFAEKEDSMGTNAEQSKQVVEEAQTEISGTNTYFVKSSDDILDVIPEFSGEAYIILNDNCPDFTLSEKESKVPFENYSQLDELGRCGTAYANICNELMPTEERGAIGQIKPSGWQLVKYDIVEGKYLYNRCHLIGYQLAGENANEKNLITGTRYLNVSGMLPFENMVANYVRETDHHVLYRVTPVYHRDDLVAAGIQMEAYSVEDEGAGICFNVFVYNNQPGIGIDYVTGESWLVEDYEPSFNEVVENSLKESANIQAYVLNTNTKKIHLPTCASVDDMKEKNKKEISCGLEELIEAGYVPCQRCIGSNEK